MGVYFVLLTLLYQFKIKDYFYWTRIALLEDSYFDFSVTRYLLAIILFLINIYFLLKLNKQKLVFIVLSIIFLLLTIPSLITFSSENMYPARLVVYHQTLFFAVYFFSKLKLSFQGVPVLNKKQALYFLFVLISIGIIPYIFVYGPYINLKNLLLQEVYITRNNMSGLTNPYFGYTYSVYTKILIPIMIVFALELRNRFLVFIGVIYLVLFYLFGAHKTVYVALIVVFIFYKLSYLTAIRKVLTLSNMLIILSGLLAVFGWDYLWILSFRRVHFLPALLDICYVDFFKERPILWSESLPSMFFEYPYDIPHAKVIGEHYFNNPNMAANNGIISDGFMNFGTYGVIINIVLVATYFMVLNSLKIPSRYFGLFILIIFSFLSSSTLTVFLTHGAIALLFIAIFLLNEKSS